MIKFYLEKKLPSEVYKPPGLEEPPFKAEEEAKTMGQRRNTLDREVSRMEADLEDWDPSSSPLLPR